ncbi:IS200/IS605 family element transposase accessory protein TnpB [Cohnella sp. LGH]|uniref:IS200/IS605 family element RNA-guided endonuclease TnpB n=1 Tax=Cohnella sp. LGH TaxID=1619153 RepID=UPI001AD986A1|nr:IS200/IS605 family element RNA-guided endonuclease TnpB [Cohnella sp. LGH]QTH43310.1 IS200/IS605 family element transposase accessory protein TnpB [Cohnella sp. LGH]
MLHHRAYKYRIYPNQEQERLIQRTFGCSRFVFNHFLTLWNETYAATGKGLSYHSCATGLPALKKQFEWLREVDSIALQSAVRHVSDAFGRFWSKQNRAPRYKNRKHPVQGYTTRCTNDNIEVIGNQLKLPKLGLIRFANSRPLEGRILSATVRRNPAGKYFVSLVCEAEIKPLPEVSGDIGIDLGLKTYAVCSDGSSIENPKVYRKYERRLAHWQRRMARRRKDGANWHKAKLKVARIHEKIAYSRGDFLHKVTTKLIRENQTISIETLRVANMLKNPKLAKSISDASWSEFTRLLMYKSEWYGRALKFAPAFAPTSQMCHRCGKKHPAVKDMTLRQWICPSCHTVHDRDENAARNIKQATMSR